MKNREKEVLVKQKRAAANALIFNLKSATSVSLPLITKLTLLSTATTTSLIFSLIEKISDSNNESEYIKKPQKQEEETLNLEARTMVARAGPPII